MTQTETTIYLVKNDRDAEVATYTRLQQAELIADEFQSLYREPYRVEEMVVNLLPDNFS
jgi:hypothetical protein